MYTFDFRKILSENGFIPDFENTDITYDYINCRDIEKFLDDDDEESDFDWYDLYTEQLDAFSSANNLFAVRFEGTNSYGEYTCDKFYTNEANKERLINFLYPDYCEIDEDEQAIYTKEEFADSLEFVVE